MGEREHRLEIANKVGEATSYFRFPCFLVAWCMKLDLFSFLSLYFGCLVNGSLENLHSFIECDVVVCILLAICEFHVVHDWKCLWTWGFSYLETQLWLFRLCEAVERGPLRLCEAVVGEWFECCTLSPVWSSEEGKDVSPYFGSLRV